MPRVKPDYIPACRLHKASGQAIVTLSGKDHLLGPHGSPAAQAMYHKLIGSWIESGRKPIGVKPVVSRDILDMRLTVGELVRAYTMHVESTYKGHDGNPSPDRNHSTIHYRSSASTHIVIV